MKKLSNGQDSTLGVYREIVVAFVGEDNAAVKFLDQKISESPHGKDEEVIANEGQMIHLLMSMIIKEQGLAQ